jgi:hypothetical protein
VPPSEKVTVPVGVPTAWEETTAVNVTTWPKGDESADEVNVSEVGAELFTTVVVALAEVLEEPDSWLVVVTPAWSTRLVLFGVVAGMKATMVNPAALEPLHD